MVAGVDDPVSVEVMGELERGIDPILPQLAVQRRERDAAGKTVRILIGGGEAGNREIRPRRGARPAAEWSALF